ncbi:MAG: hypothetical protein PVG27_07750, partial [Chloroflexota bacterium]
MFSAVKFIAAGVIVALLGGFLVAGVLTLQQDGEVPPAAVSASPTAQSELNEATDPPDPQPPPITTEELLAGMITEEVEPGVLRVLNDGVRDMPCEGWPCAVVAGQDGSIWLVRDGDDYRIDRLGSLEPHTSLDDWDVMAPDGTVWRSDTRMVASDGTDWVSDEKPKRPPKGVRELTRLQALEDGSWTVRVEGPELRGWTIAPDGTVWGSYRTEDRDPVVARLGADGWEPLEDAPASGDLVVTQSGELWVGGGWLGRYMEHRDDGSWRVHEGGSLWRYREDDGTWHEVTVDAVVHHPAEQHVAVGPDGTVWFAGAEPLMRDGKPVPDAFRDPTMPRPGDPFLMRFDGTEWQRWGPEDGVPPLGAEATPPDLMPTRDGGLWLVENPYQCADDWGVARFDVDGPTWRHFFSGDCITSMDIAADGAVWLMTPTNDEDDTFELYVITPEAVAAKPAELIEPASV